MHLDDAEFQKRPRKSGLDDEVAGGIFYLQYVVVTITECRT